MVGRERRRKFWLSSLTDLKNRGLRDLFVACIDGLSGFADAIRAAKRIQRRHLISERRLRQPHKALRASAARVC